MYYLVCLYLIANIIFVPFAFVRDILAMKRMKYVRSIEIDRDNWCELFKKAVVENTQLKLELAKMRSDNAAR